MKSLSVCTLIGSLMLAPAANLTLDDNSVLNSNTNNITIAGNWDNQELTPSGGFTESTATVTFDDAKTNPDVIAAASMNAGYPAHPTKQGG